MTIFISLGEAGAAYPSADGRGVGSHAVTRHITRGVRLKSGQRLQLQALRTPAGWVTTRAWLDEFLTALTLDRTGRTPKERPSPAAARADSLLRAEGW
jgi:hypothetical protein